MSRSWNHLARCKPRRGSWSGSRSGVPLLKELLATRCLMIGKECANPVNGGAAFCCSCERGKLYLRAKSDAVAATASARTTDGKDAASLQRQRRRDVLRELLVLVVGHRGRRRAAPCLAVRGAESPHRGCKRWVFGCRPVVYQSEASHEHEWLPLRSDPALFANCCCHWSVQTRTVLGLRSAPGEAMGQRSQDASKRGEAAQGGW